jgi:hypothetical protein
MQLKKPALLALLCVAMGCEKNSDFKKEQGGSLLLMYARTENGQNVAARIAADVLRVGVEKGRLLLCNRLDDVYNTELKDSLLPLLYEELRIMPELRKALLGYYTRKPPRKLSEEFYRQMWRKDSFFTDFIDVYIAAGSTHRLGELIAWFENKGGLTEAELLRYAELVFINGDLSKANLVIDKKPDWSMENLQARAILLAARIAFYQSRYRHCVELLLSFFELRCESPAIDILVDAFLLLREPQKASKMLSVISSGCFETADYHVLQSKVMLFSKNHHDALRHWEIARSLDSKGERFEVLSFYLSHYFPDKVPSEAIGRFRDWQNTGGRRNATDPLRFYRDRIYLAEYESLYRADAQTAELLKNRIAANMLQK